MHSKKPVIASLLFLIAGFGAFADSVFLVNARYQSSFYAIYEAVGQDELRLQSAGLGFRSMEGEGLTGVIDLAAFFPFHGSYKDYPAAGFSDMALSAFPFGIETMMGLGYSMGTEIFRFTPSAGMHIAAMFDGGDYLMSVGLALDALVAVNFGERISMHFGGNFAVDFAGSQSYGSTLPNFSGLPVTFCFYSGIGFRH